MPVIRRIIFTLLLFIICVLPTTTGVNAQEPIVRAVILYSPSCPHCMTVINEILPQLDQQYGTQLVVYGANTHTDTGHQLFENTAQAFNTPEDRQVVPTLVVGDQVLVGSGEIAGMFPAIIDQGIKDGGIDWPAIPDLIEAMSAPETDSPADTTSTFQSQTLKDRFTSDLGGNILSVIVLLGMLGAVYYSAASFLKGSQTLSKSFPEWLIPLLSLIGIGIAGYLSYVEFNQVEAICGPVGNCNTVQQSSYAKLFGVIPIGFLGALGYLAVIIFWLLDSLNLPELKQIPRLALWIITLAGTLFSIYLTFLEPFVIGATCIWCISSAVLMTFLYLLATRKLAPESGGAEYTPN